MSSHRHASLLALAAVAGWLMTATVAGASEATVTGTLSAGKSFVQPFTATATGTVALRLEWDDPSAKLNLFLLQRGSNGAYKQIAAATGAEMPQVIVRDVVPGSTGCGCEPRGTTTYQLWTRYPTAPPAQPLPGYLTLMFGRSMIGSATASCALRPGAVSLFTIADQLQARGIAASSNATISQIGTCGGTIRYATWDELAKLRDSYGWSLTSRGKTSRDIATLGPADQYDETCGSLQVFAEHGFDRAWGMYSYPGGDPVESVQEGPVDQCFSYGRDYEPLSNPYPMACPYLALVDDVIGGRCHNPAMACYRMTVKSSRWYMPPALLAAYANAGVDGTGRWAILQFYRIVSGHSGTTTSTSPAWNCDSADPRDHWTSQPELYCLNDMLWVIDHVDPRITYSDEATLGAAQGRDFSAGTLPGRRHDWSGDERRTGSRHDRAAGLGGARAVGAGVEGRVDGLRPRRLAEIKVQLDQCWDLLRQRRALREFDLDDDGAQLRKSDVVEGYQQ